MPIERGSHMSKRNTCSENTHTREQMNHHSNQCNPNNAVYKQGMNTHTSQLNTNNTKAKG